MRVSHAGVISATRSSMGKFVSAPEVIAIG